MEGSLIPDVGSNSAFNTDSRVYFSYEKTYYEIHSTSEVFQIAGKH